MLAEYGPLTTRELNEIHGKSMADAEQKLCQEADAGRLTPIERRGGMLWRLPDNS